MRVYLEHTAAVRSRVLTIQRVQPDPRTDTHPAPDSSPSTARRRRPRGTSGDTSPPPALQGALTPPRSAAPRRRPGPSPPAPTAAPRPPPPWPRRRFRLPARARQGGPGAAQSAPCGRRGRRGPGFPRGLQGRGVCGSVRGLPGHPGPSSPHLRGVWRATGGEATVGRSQNNWRSDSVRLEGTAGGHLVQPPCPSWAIPGMMSCSDSSWISPVWEATRLLWATCSIV